MFGPDYKAGFPSCSAIADRFNGFWEHLASHDVRPCRDVRGEPTDLPALVVAAERAGRRYRHGARRRSRWLSHWLTVFFNAASASSELQQGRKIDRSMPIVAEAERIADRRNSSLKSRARIFDGSARRFFVVRRRNLRR
jgi:hypothetical protein